MRSRGPELPYPARRLVPPEDGDCRPRGRVAEQQQCAEPGECRAPSSTNCASVSSLPSTLTAGRRRLHGPARRPDRAVDLRHGHLIVVDELPHPAPSPLPPSRICRDAVSSRLRLRRRPPGRFSYGRPRRDRRADSHPPGAALEPEPDAEPGASLRKPRDRRGVFHRLQSCARAGALPPCRRALTTQSLPSGHGQPYPPRP